MSDLFIPECNATPHPAAIASGTCPAPSPEPTPTGQATPSAAPSADVTTVPEPTHQATTASAGVADHGDDSPHLPQTGLDLGWAVLGVVVCVLGVVALLWGSLRDRF
jgi:hypothetical protein